MSDELETRVAELETAALKREIADTKRRMLDEAKAAGDVERFEQILRMDIDRSQREIDSINARKAHEAREQWIGEVMAHAGLDASKRRDVDLALARHAQVLEGIDADTCAYRLRAVAKDLFAPPPPEPGPTSEEAAIASMNRGNHTTGRGSFAGLPVAPDRTIDERVPSRQVSDSQKARLVCALNGKK